MPEFSEKANRVIRDGFTEFWNLNRIHLRGMDALAIRMAWTAGFTNGAKFAGDIGFDLAKQSVKEVFGV
jgi:hypothetical protein